jgi:hypothetical protein
MPHLPLRTVALPDATSRVYDAWLADIEGHCISKLTSSLPVILFIPAVVKSTTLDATEETSLFFISSPISCSTIFMVVCATVCSSSTCFFSGVAGVSAI